MSARPRMLQILPFSAIYFGMVFAVGFLLGPIRVLILEPRVGIRWAELMEMPLMLAAIYFSARWLVKRQAQHWNAPARLAAGLIAMALVLAADISVGIGLRGMSFTEVFTGRDPISGTAYYLSLLVFGLAPWAVARRWMNPTL